MDLNWKSYLESNKAIFLNNTVLHFQNEQQQRDSLESADYDIITALSHYGLIKVSGSEALPFLQSQFSNDVKLVSKSQAQLNSYCSPKGRVLALFTILKIQENYFLHIPESLLESTMKRLNMFKMRADVNIEDASAEWQCLGISIKAANTLLSKYFHSFPENDYQCLSSDNINLIRLPNSSSNKSLTRLLLFAKTPDLIKIWDSRSENCIPIGQGAWSWLDIQSGIPNIEPETVDSFVPQMINLQLLNAVNFSKGCYPGQEIVARTKYLGKLKRRMYLLTSESDQLLPAGTELSTQNASDDQSKGKIVNCQLTPQNNISILAVLQMNSLNDGNFILKSDPNIVFNIQQLPYLFEATDK